MSYYCTIDVDRYIDQISSGGSQSYILSLQNSHRTIQSNSAHGDVIKWKHIIRVTCPLCGEFTGHR